MPWRGPEIKGEFPTLGYQVADWIETWCVIPDGPRAGEPFLLTDEMLQFLFHYYRLHPETGAWWYPRGGQLVRPQKWGKGPFSAAVICAESHEDGPVVFDGWDADGEPVGRGWDTPLTQITAISEDQTANVQTALVPMIQRGPLADEWPDTGLTRVNLPGGGRIEPVTASATSRLGARVTFVVQDETHAWLPGNGGRKLADVQRRGLAGMGARFLETTNAWNPAEESVAQQTWELEDGVWKDMSDGGAGSVRNKRERRRVLTRVYGDSVAKRGGRGWIDLDRIDMEIEALLGRDAAQAERFFLNRIRSEADGAFDLHQWKSLACPSWMAPDNDLVVVGVDGARYRDALAVVACHVQQGHIWPLGIWTRPEDAGDDYEHPFHEVDETLQEAWDRWSVWRVYVDPQMIDSLLDRWQGRWGDKRVLPWVTSRHKAMAHAVRSFSDAITGGDLTHDGDPVLERHIANARKWRTQVKDEEGRPMSVIGKDRTDSPRKMDAAVAAVLAWEARGDAIAADAKPDRRGRRLAFL